MYCIIHILDHALLMVYNYQEDILIGGEGGGGGRGGGGEEGEGRGGVFK